MSRLRGYQIRELRAFIRSVGQISVEELSRLFRHAGEIVDELVDDGSVCRGRNIVQALR